MATPVIVYIFTLVHVSLRYMCLAQLQVSLALKSTKWYFTYSTVFFL